MTLDEALEYIHSVGSLGSRLGLDRLTKLLSLLGNPHEKCRYVHVAGTNGKGSVSSMTASVLSSAGYKTGLFTSPYLFKFNERIQIDGKMIPDDELAEITGYLAPIADSMDDHPTEFEVVTAIGFIYFARNNCDVVVLEVGLGGRLDATNIISSPLCSVITAIGIDHTKELGDKIEGIAFEKAGIVKQNCDTVLYEQSDSIMDVVIQVCAERNSPLHTADFSQIEPISDGIEGQQFKYKDSDEYTIPLLGPHQLKNASVCLEVFEVLRSKGFDIPDSAVKQGLSKTYWPARFEIVSRNPFFIVDGGHNPQCAESVVGAFTRYFPQQSAVLLMGVMADKDLEGMTSLLDKIAGQYVTVTPNNPRALPAPELAEFLSRYGKPVTVCNSIPEAVDTSKKLAGDNGVVCSVGSLYMAGDVRSEFGLF